MVTTIELSERTTVTDIVDTKALGRLLRASRIAAGFDTTQAAADAATLHGHIRITDRMIGSLERGDTNLNLHMLILLSTIYRPHGGARYYLNAVAEPWRSEFEW